MYQTLHATSLDGLSQEFVAATAGKEWNSQDARGGGLCPRLEKNYTLERSSKSFPGIRNISESLENCQQYIKKSQCSLIQETRS